jgi:DNA (cytosine-5)-methyltransferase 1
MGLDEALDDLESIQYSTEALIVPACAVGAPHKRDRIWIIGRDTFAHSSSERLEGSEREEPQGRIDGFAHGGWLATNAHGAGCEKQRRSKSASEGYEAPQCPRWWTIEPELDRVVDGVPNRVDKLTGLGNAIVPHVAYEFMRFMKEIDRNGI